MSDQTRTIENRPSATPDPASSHGHWFLHTAVLEDFGAFQQKSVGPFEPGLNVVYGANEAGKTTLAAFIRGVLFGWPLARGKRNGYVSASGSRGGRLIFEEDDGQRVQVARYRNADGLQGETWLIDDVDAPLYQTLFTFDGGQLESLDDVSTVTAKMLTAQAGTQQSPAQVLAGLEQRLQLCFSHARQYPNSLPNIQTSIAEADARVAALSEGADRLFEARKEYDGLILEREETTRELGKANDDVAYLKARVSLLDNLEEQRDQSILAQRALDDATEHQSSASYSNDEHQNDVEGASHEGSFAATKADGFVTENRRLRDVLGRLHERTDQLQRDLDAAQDRLQHAEERNEVLQQETAYLKAAGQERHTRKMQAVASIILPIVVLLLGVPVFAYGNGIGSMTVTAFGIALIIASILMLVAALVALLRPNQSDDLVSQRRADATWIVQQEQERVRHCEAALNKHREYVASYLKQQGFGDDASIDQALSQLDEDYLKLGSQDADTDLSAKRNTLSEQTRSLQERIDALLADAGATDVVALDALANRATAKRDQLQDALDRCNHRIGQLSQMLDEAVDDTQLDEARQNRANLAARFEAAAEEYATLLIAHRDLSQAIAVWERESQPAVFRHASNLFSAMTNGSWQSIERTAQEGVQVVDADGRVLLPHQLSLGTRQQLYLSLRIALLQTARTVGRHVPVIADDILASFDDERRVAAVKALLQLAEQRQVLLFTGNQEVVSLVRSLAPTVNLVTLSRTGQSL